MVDASFALDPEFKSHAWASMSSEEDDGKGLVQSGWRKQTLNTKSSTEAELIEAGNISSVVILLTKFFLQGKGYEIHRNILYQDNKSAILLEENGKKISSKRTRA